MVRKGPNVVVIGPAYIDMAFRCPQFPGPGQVTIGSGLSYSAAGPGPAQAVEAVLCGCNVHLITKIGGDPFGALVCSSLGELGVCIDLIKVAPALNTGVVVTWVDANGENATCRYPGANSALQPADIEAAEQVIAEASVCLIHGQLPQDAIVKAICLAQVHGTRVLLNPAGPLTVRARPDEGLPTEYFLADVLIANYFEAAQITESVSCSQANVHDAKLMGSDLVARGVRYAVITLGRKGCVLVDRNGGEHIPAFEVELVHQTGRGDAFAGALAAYLAVDDDMHKAVEFASAAGALACTKFGSIEAMPTREEIIRLLQGNP